MRIKPLHEMETPARPRKRRSPTAGADDWHVQS